MSKKKKNNEPFEFEDWRDKRKIKKYILLSLFSLIIILFGGYFGYFYFYRNTTSYLDKSTKKIELAFTNIFSKIQEFGDNDLTNLDTQISGKYKITYDNKTYDLDLSLIESNDKLISALTGSLKKEEKEIFNGLLQVQDNNIIVKSPNISSKTLYSNLNHNLILKNSNIINISGYTGLEDIKYMVGKLILYHKEALKKGTLKTNIVGLNLKEYKVSLDDNERNEASKRLKELIEQDEKLSQIIKNLNITSYDLLQVGELSIIVNTLTEQIDSFSLTSEGKTWQGKWDGQKLILTNASTKYEVWLTDNTIKINIYENDFVIKEMELVVNNQDLNISYKTKETGEIKVTLTKINDKDYNLVWDSSNIQFNLKIEEVAENIRKITGSGSYKKDSKKWQIECDANIAIRENLISEIDLDDAKNIEDLNEAEKKEITDNLANIKESLKKE